MRGWVAGDHVLGLRVGWWLTRGAVAGDSQHLIIGQQSPGQVLNQRPAGYSGLHPLIHIGQVAGGAPRPGREQSPAPLGLQGGRKRIQ